MILLKEFLPTVYYITDIKNILVNILNANANTTELCSAYNNHDFLLVLVMLLTMIINAIHINSSFTYKCQENVLSPPNV